MKIVAFSDTHANLPTITRHPLLAAWITIAADIHGRLAGEWPAKLPKGGETDLLELNRAKGDWAGLNYIQRHMREQEVFTQQQLQRMQKTNAAATLANVKLPNVYQVRLAPFTAPGLRVKDTNLDGLFARRPAPRLSEVGVVFKYKQGLLRLWMTSALVRTGIAWSLTVFTLCAPEFSGLEATAPAIQPSHPEAPWRPDLRGLGGMSSRNHTVSGPSPRPIMETSSSTNRAMAVRAETSSSGPPSLSAKTCRSRKGA